MERGRERSLETVVRQVIPCQQTRKIERLADPPPTPTLLSRVMLHIYSREDVICPSLAGDGAGQTCDMHVAL